MIRNKATRRSGFSLLDTLAAGAVMAIVLTPALSSMRQGLELSRDAEVLQITTTLCVGKIEEHLSIVAANFAENNESGNFTADGFADYRYTANCSANPADGGIADRLMAIEVTVWHDDNGDNAITVGEIQTTLNTKVAKMATYVEGAL